MVSINDVNEITLMEMFELIRELIHEHTKEKLVTKIIHNEQTDTFMIQIPLGNISNMEAHVELHSADDKPNLKYMRCRILVKPLYITISSHTLVSIDAFNNQCTQDAEQPSSSYTDYYEMKCAYFTELKEKLTGFYSSVVMRLVE